MDRQQTITDAYDGTARQTRENGLCGTRWDSGGTGTLRLAERADAPTVTATGHDGEPVEFDYENAVVYTFPNADGCRCGAMVQQFDALARELDVSVYGVAPSEPDELLEMADRYGLSDGHTLVADPYGNVAKEFGVGFDADSGTVDRSTHFIRGGKVIERVDGMVALQFEPESEGLTVNQPPAILGTIEHPSVVTIVGKRGAGKSSTAYWIGEQLHRHEGLIPVTVAIPEHVHSLFPPGWVHVEDIQQAPPNSVVVVDEAYRMLHAREWQKNDSVKISKLINLSRQCNRTIVFVTQSTKQLDGNVPLESDAVVMKEPGALHERMERREMRPLIEEANNRFGGIPESTDRRGFAYIVSDDDKVMVETREADFFTDALSNAFGGVCGQYQNDD